MFRDRRAEFNVRPSFRYRSMRLNHGLHLCYSTNVHRGETWAETFEAVRTHSLAVKAQVSPHSPYALGLRLSDVASRELSEANRLSEFKSWMKQQGCYLFTVNGFPYGRFHGTRVKEQVYAPDWTTPERLEYTIRLFDIVGALVPEGVEGSVSTVPCSFKEFIQTDAQRRTMRDNIWRAVEHIEKVSQRSGRKLHLGLEPEPLCYLEDSSETVQFFEELRADRPGDQRLDQYLGVNYDACHLAIEFEEPRDVVRRFRDHGVKVSKLHLSSALCVVPSAKTLAALRPFVDQVYFHQVIERGRDGALTRYRDLDVALEQAEHRPPSAGVEWRIHFHIPLHSQPSEWFETTSNHILGLLDSVREDPSLCHHLEMETYTWEVLPAALKQRSVVDQLVDEYRWCLARLGERGIKPV